MFRELSPWHLVIILIALFVLFGYKKLPDATRSLGRSMRIFKSEVKGLHDDEPRSVESTPAATPTPTVAQPQVAQPQSRAAADPAAAGPAGIAGRTGACLARRLRDARRGRPHLIRPHTSRAGGARTQMTDRDG